MKALPTELVRLGDLRPYPGNPNEGDDEAVAELLRRHGQWRPAVVQRSTGQVLIGNTMLRAAQRIGWDRLHVHYRDVDDDEARRIVAADNRARDLAHYDERKLVKLLAGVDDLDGTGYADDDLDELRALVEEQDAASLRAMRADGDDRPDPDDTGRPTPQVRTTPGQREYLDAYGDKGTRHLALIYPVDAYVWLVDRMEKIADELGVESNAEVVLALIEAHTGEQAPPMHVAAEVPAEVPA